MKTMVLFKADEKLIAIDNTFVKKEYKKEELFGERESKSNKIKVRLDGKEIPFYDLPALFSGLDDETRENINEGILIKDDEGHMVLLVDKVLEVVEAEEEFIEALSPIFGEHSCSCFPEVFKKDGFPFLIIDPLGIRAGTCAEMGDG